MLGEIRDSETAAIAFRAAQTGHLMLSTLHTNDAPSAVTRLLDLDIEHFLISASLVAVVGQRLVRKICPKCKVLHQPSSRMVKQIAPYIGDDEQTAFWKGSGCKACLNTGYKGRLGIFEIMIMTPALKEALGPNVSGVTLKKIAEKNGFRSMFRDGLEKVFQGLTTLSEILRVTPHDIMESADKPSEPSDGANSRRTMTEPGSVPYEGKASNERSMPTILVVDDSELFQKMIMNTFKSTNYTIYTAENGAEAMDLVERKKPNLIITDCMMPEMDGLGLIKKIRSRAMTRHIPIIMLTAKDGLDSEINAIGAGADDYLIKPCNPKRLLARVNRLIVRSMTDKIFQTCDVDENDSRLSAK